MMNEVFRGLVSICVLASGCDFIFGISAVPAPPPDAAPDAPPPASAWATVAPGADHSCGIHVDGTLWCWGRNDKGQLATAMPIESPTPVQIGTDTWTALSVREAHSCAIRADRTLWCWGDNESGQLGTGDTNGVMGLRQVGTATDWTAVSVGSFAGFAINSANELWGWGDASAGRVGNGVTTGIFAPTHITAPAGWKQVSAGGDFGCGLDLSGNAWCWGDDSYGELGGASSGYRSSPTQVSGTDTWTMLASGQRFVCGLRAGGGARCWGQDDDGQLGDDNTSSTRAHQIVGGDQITDWVEIAAGENHACARRSDGGLYCWGVNEHDELAVDTPGLTHRGQPVKVSAAASIAIGLGGDSTCAIDSGHRAWCAGRSGVGQLASIGSHTTPTAITGTWLGGGESPDFARE